MFIEPAMLNTELNVQSLFISRCPSLPSTGIMKKEQLIFKLHLLYMHVRKPPLHTGKSSNLKGYFTDLH